LFGNCPRQGLLAVDVLLLSGGLGGHERMPVVRHRQHDGVDVRARHHFPVIVVRFAILVVVMVVDGVHRRLQMVLVQITCGHDLAVLQPKKGLRVARTLHSPSDHAQGDALGRRGPVIATQRAGWYDGWCGHC
jgi:hypothetical protein